MRHAHMQWTAADGWDRAMPDLEQSRTLIIVFGDADLANTPEPIAQLLERYPQATLVGCSTAGQIMHDSIKDGGAFVTFITFEQPGSSVKATLTQHQGDTLDTARQLVAGLQTDNLRGVLVLSDGLLVNGSDLAQGLRDSLPPRTCITGGLAGDGQRFEHTWVCCNGLPQPSGVVAVGFYGNSIGMWHGCRGGWDTFGPARKVTQSEGNVLYALDDKPALTLYKEYLGELAEGLPGSALLYPLAIRHPDHDRILVRTVLAVNEDDDSMTFAGDIPQGWTAQLMNASFDRIIDGAGEAAAMVPHHLDEDASALCVSISCVGRRMLLRHRAEEELDEVLDALPANTSQIGFYSYGELSPLADSPCELHNQTMTLTLIAERPGGFDALDSHASAA
ncbi:MAG: FIST C-terminal domain-containing protein [Phycisphaerales bacterium]|nr:FIST C-terminal domain-containing protein [Phycisphaerales bacterium]